MAKTFKIGEYALGGIIKIATDTNANINVEVRDWDDQSLVERKKFSFVDKFKIQMYLEEVTTSYYADKIMNHIYL